MPAHLWSKLPLQPGAVPASEGIVDLRRISSDHKSLRGSHAGLDRLLELDGQSFGMGEGFVAKVRAKRVPPDAGRPHGVDYALVLIGPDEKRRLSYDNAHAARSGSGPTGRKRPPFDHRDRGERSEPNRFSDAETLMIDFWTDVNRILVQEGVISCSTSPEC